MSFYCRREEKPIYITGFNPSATSKDAHHILLYGCSEPGHDQKIWNCGEMAASQGDVTSKYPSGNVCGSASSIIYAWALDAQKMELPKDVAFKLGGSTQIKYLVLQVHYANIDKFKAGETDRSGLILTTTNIPTSKTAGVMLLLSQGRIRAQSEEVFQISCLIEEDLVLHPLAFRTHAHKLGLVISGYRVRGTGDDQEWTELGRRSPLLPQMFYPIEKNLTIEQGDRLTATCSMYNSKSHTVRIGPTSDDEMCNFYLMYWVEGDRLIRDGFCRSAGPPEYYFRNDPELNVDKMPETAFRIPSPPNGQPLSRSIDEIQHMAMHHSHPMDTSNTHISSN